MTAVRRLPALVLLAVLALLPIEAWFRVLRPQVVVTDPAPEVEAITWAGTVREDGRLAVAITYEKPPTVDEIDVRVPPGGRLLRVNGEPAAATIGRYATLEIGGPVTVEYELAGAVTRYEDGALLRLGTVADGSVSADSTLFPCASCYLDVGYGNIALHGVLSATELDGFRIALGHVSQIHAAVDPPEGAVGAAARFVGSLPSIQAPPLLATLPASAVPDLEITDGSVAEAFDLAVAELEAAGVPVREPSNSAGLSRHVVAIVLTALFAGLVAFMVARFRRVRRDDAIAGSAPPPPGDVAHHVPPSALEPALAGLVVGPAGPGFRSIVGGTLLALAHRGAIRIEGIDSQRYTLTLPAGAAGATATEEAVLAALRPQGSSSAAATFTGPPLWGGDTRPTMRRIRRVTVKEGMRQGLVRLTLSGLVLVPISVAMGIVALVGSAGLSWIGWFAVFGGPVLAAVASVATGVSLTRRGRDERDRLRAYADWLRDSSQLERVGAPGVAIWGEVLPVAAAIGAAPVAAEALSPRT